MLQALRILLAAWVALASTVCAAPVPHEFTGLVIHVTDGDTIVIEDRQRQRDKVRIVSIDAPEKGRRGIAGQPYSERSRQHLAELINARTVRLVSPGRDDYGRVLARVWVGDTDVGQAQVCAGYAWVFEAFVDELPIADQHTYRACEAKARQARRGLWRRPRPIPPWKWRHLQRDAEAGR